MPAADSLAGGYLPLGLAHKVRLKAGVPAGTPIRWCDVAHDEQAQAVRFRREMEQACAPAAQDGPAAQARAA